MKKKKEINGEKLLVTHPIHIQCVISQLAWANKYFIGIIKVFQHCSVNVQ